MYNSVRCKYGFGDYMTRASLPRRVKKNLELFWFLIFKGLGACYAVPSQEIKVFPWNQLAKGCKCPKFSMRKSKLRNQKIHSKLEEWTQLIKKLTLCKRSWSRVIELSMTYFLTKRLVHPYFDIKVPFLRLLPVESGGKLKNPKLRNNFSRIHSKFCSGQITYWMGDYEIFRHKIKKWCVV